MFLLVQPLLFNCIKSQKNSGLFYFLSSSKKKNQLERFHTKADLYFDAVTTFFMVTLNENNELFF